MTSADYRIEKVGHKHTNTVPSHAEYKLSFTSSSTSLSHSLPRSSDQPYTITSKMSQPQLPVSKFDPKDMVRFTMPLIGYAETDTKYRSFATLVQQV